jgi:lysophospholipase
MRVQFDRRAQPGGARFDMWSSADGCDVRRMAWPPPAGAPVRGSLLFVSGRADFVEKYWEALAHWHMAGWNVTSFDWRGQGGSGAGAQSGFDPLVADLRAFVHDMVAKSPAPHVVVAHSMGAHVLLRLLAQERPAIEAAVMVAPMIGINSAPLPAWLARLAADLMAAVTGPSQKAWKQNEHPAAGTRRQSFLTSSRERYEDELWWRAESDYPLHPPSWAWLAAAYRSMRSLRSSDIRKVATPILILGSEHDRLVDPSAIERVARLLPHAELHMFPAAGHELLREEDPIRLDALARIDVFLAGHAPL